VQAKRIQSPEPMDALRNEAEMPRFVMIKDMGKLTTLARNNESLNVNFLGSQQVKDGIICDVYKFTDDDSCDLGVVSVSAGSVTPRQKILTGDRTIEGFMKGQGTLKVTHPDGGKTEHHFPGNVNEVELHVGDIMQWEANTDLTFYEICFPKYKDGRFQNLD